MQLMITIEKSCFLHCNVLISTFFLHTLYKLKQSDHSLQWHQT